MSRLILAAVFCVACTIPAAAQFSDDFSDGDVSANPAWTGTTDRWTVTSLDGDPALRSNGPARSDTIYLATPSAVSRGTWSFTFAHRDVNLSTFNGTRIYLTADAPDLQGDVFGYYLQMGTNNTDEVRLYRQDGDPGVASRRVLLGRSTDAFLTGTDNTLSVSVTRSPANAWTVQVDGTPVFSVTDDTYTTSRFFGVWIKHTEATTRSYFFDDVVVQGEAGPFDTTPPELVRASALDAERVEVAFNEGTNACSPDRYEISNGIGRPAGLEACLPAGGQTSYVLLLARPLQNGRTYLLTVRNIPDEAGNVLAEASTPFTYIEPGTPPPAPGDVVVNEIYYDPPESDLEFVEVFNRTGRPFDLRRFLLADDRLEPVAVTDTPRILAPGGFAVFARSAAAFSTAFPGVDFIEVPAWPSLNNSGDTVVLFYDDTVLDAVAYEPSWGGADRSLERRDPNGPSDRRFNFGPSEADAGATPGSLNSIFAPDVAPPTLVFAEQIGEAELDVYPSEPVAFASVSPDAFELDDGRRPQLAVLDDEATRIRLRFAEALSGFTISVQRLRDLSGNASASLSHAIAFRAAPGDLAIHEIMYDPLADGFDHRPDQPEYIELVNRSRRTLTLRNHYWTDVPNEHGAADTLRFGSSFFSIAPEGFAVVFADPDSIDDPVRDSKLARAFPEIDLSPGTITLIPLPRTSLGLGNSADLVHLHRPDDLPLDSVMYQPAWHHPNLIDATGVALERLTVDGHANTATHWTSSVAPDGGTPGRPNSVGLRPGVPEPEATLAITPSPFSPDRDGVDDVAAIRYTLDQEASLVRVRIFDTWGRPVRALEEAMLAGRTGQLLWDGLDDDGRDLRIGIYVVLFEALDTHGGTTTVFKEPVVLARPLD